MSQGTIHDMRSAIVKKGGWYQRDVQYRMEYRSNLNSIF